jgi:hypothetical protein
VFTVDNEVTGVICPRCAVTYPGYRREGHHGRGILDRYTVYWPDDNGVFIADPQPPAFARSLGRANPAPTSRPEWKPAIEEQGRNIRRERYNARVDAARAAKGLRPLSEIPGLPRDQ